MVDKTLFEPQSPDLHTYGHKHVEFIGHEASCIGSIFTNAHAQKIRSFANTKMQHTVI